MPLDVRNTQRGPVVFAKGPVEVSWRPAGDPGGEDYQICPDSLAEDPDFLKSVVTGLLVIESASPDVLAKINEFKARKSRITRNYDATTQENYGLNAIIDRPQDRELTLGQCVECGAGIITPVKKNADRPPLCEQHSGLAEFYTLEETGSVGSGDFAQNWTKIRFG